MIRISCFAAAFAVIAFGAAQAAVIDSSSTGLAAPGSTVDFSEVALANGTVVTNQFEAFGVTFDPAAAVTGQFSARPNFTAPVAFNFGNVNNNFTFFDPFSIRFTDTVTEAVMNLSGNNRVATITSKLNGVAVEQFSTTLDLSANNFYGFTDSLFDEISIDVGSNNPGAGIDNISFTVAPVPLPAGLPLLIAGLGAFAFARRKS